MTKISLPALADQLPRAWNSTVVGQAAGANLKVLRMDEWLARKGLSWDGVESTFYSDSFNDVPLLERVDHPVATNPDARLRELAGQRGWRVLDLFGEAS